MLLHVSLEEIKRRVVPAEIVVEIDDLLTAVGEIEAV
jgi:hypothetical protein